MLYEETGRPTVMSPYGMVAAAHPLAAQSGVHVMQQGGNAIDAAIAVNAVLNVTQPQMCGLGGDLFALIYDADTHKLTALNGMEDFRDHHSDWVEPISTTYRGYQIAEHPPNSQGFALLLQLNLVEGFDLEKLGHLTPDYLHLLIEAKKLAFTDRDHYNTDPEWESIPIDELLSKDYAATRRNLIDHSRAADATVHGDPTAGDTTYFCVVDAAGNAVSLIQSIFHGFGCGVIAGNTGLFIQNRMAYFSLNPSHANRLEPYKRTAHTLNPAMILKNGKPYIVLGTMGGDGQTQTLLQLTSALLDFGLHPQAAIELPRWRNDHGKEVSMEGRFSAEIYAGLKDKGHVIRRVENWSNGMGHSHIIAIRPDALMGAADPRGDGVAIGY